MSWAQRRKATYTLSFISIVIIILIIIFFSVFYKKPTCFDGIQNEGEQGIDCGGPCTKLCRANYVNPTVLWIRWAKVLSSGAYNILAYAENPNIGVGASNVPYEFKIYDKNSILLYDGKGFASIPANNDFVAFVSGINIHDKIPTRIDFEFTGAFNWKKIPNVEKDIVVSSKNLINEDTAPKLFATLQNGTLNQVDNIESVAILYDQNANAIAFSKTVTDSIAPGASADIVFTWPEPFGSQVYKIDIISQVLQQ